MVVEVVCGCVGGMRGCAGGVWLVGVMRGCAGGV